jgi:SAM-dependent methyltransferase
VKEAPEWQAQQIASWNGNVGDYWVARQERLDEVLEPVGAAATALAVPLRGERVPDVGCGCGATAVILAKAVGSEGHVTGLDISAPMLARARERSIGIPQIDWVLADAATHEFTPRSFDLLFSRFGVMFFGDPVAAFTNLRRGLRPGGRLTFACWRSLVENPWMHLPFRATLNHVPPPPRPEQEEPGPFSFADQDRVTRILTVAGFAAPEFTRLEVTIDLANGAGLEAAVQQATEFGAARRVLENQPDAVRAAAREAIRIALAPHVHDGTVSLPGAAWLVSSR